MMQPIPAKTGCRSCVERRNSSKPLVEQYFTRVLLGTNSNTQNLLKSIKNVAFLFTQNDVFGDGIKYWSFDAAETTLYLKQDKDDDSYSSCRVRPTKGI